MLILHNWCKCDYLISDNKFLKQLYTIVVLGISVKQMSDVKLIETKDLTED